MASKGTKSGGTRGVARKARANPALKPKRTAKKIKKEVPVSHEEIGKMGDTIESVATFGTEAAFKKRVKALEDYENKNSHILTPSMKAQILYIYATKATRKSLFDRQQHATDCVSACDRAEDGTAHPSVSMWKREAEEFLSEENTNVTADLMDEEDE